MGLDGSGQNVAHFERSFAFRRGAARTVIGYRQNRTEVVRGVAPFGGKPGIVIIEPADSTADIKSGFDRVELKRSPRNARTVGDNSARYGGAKVAPARGIL